MLAVALECERSGRNRLDGPKGIAFDARHLNETCDRIASHSEMVFERDLGRILDLLGRSAHDGSKTRRGHRRRRSDFALTAHLRA